MTVSTERENLLIQSELEKLELEVEQSCAMKTSFKAREQLLRFENVFRYYSNVYDLDDNYEKEIFEMKLKLFRQNELHDIQFCMLEELRSLAMDIKYLSKM